MSAVMLTAAPAAANTTVKVKGDVVTITVPIDCAGCKGAKGPDGSDLAKYWEKIAEQAWNDAFAQQPYCSKYKFELQVEIHAKGADFNGKKGHHLVQVAAPGGGSLRGVGWEGMKEQNPSGKPGQVSPDGTRFFDGDHDGVFPSDATPTVIEHEIGHALGLGDDRDKSGDPIPGREGTLMEGGAKGVTPGTPLRIDQALIDRIGRQLEKLGYISKCKSVTYEGTVRGHRDYAGQSVDGGGTASIVVDEHHRVSGTVQTSETCNCGGAPIASNASWNLHGHADEHRITITGVDIVHGGYFDEVLPNVPFSIARLRGGKASASLQGGDLSIPGGTISFELQCTSCEEAVG